MDKILLRYRLTLRQKELFKQTKKQATKNHLTYLHHSLQLIDVNRLVLEL